MSQAEQIRTEVLKNVAEEEREAFLAAVVRGLGSMQIVKQGVQLVIEGDKKDVIDAIKPIIIAEGITEFQYSLRDDGAKSGKYSITVSTKQSKELLLGLGLIEEDFVPKTGIDPDKIYSSSEKLGFIKGLFAALGSASLSDEETKHGYHVEMNVADESLAAALLELLSELELDKWHSVSRKYTTGVYLKDGEQAFEFLILMGATKTALELQGAIAMKELRNNINRQNNIQSANLDKTVNASLDVIQDIDFLEREGVLDKLPAVLAETARLRRENPDVSLQDLAAIRGNTTKSGMSHRIKKLQRLAEEERKKLGRKV